MIDDRMIITQGEGNCQMPVMVCDRRWLKSIEFAKACWDHVKIAVILPGLGEDRRDQMKIVVILPGSAEDCWGSQWSHRDQMKIDGIRWVLLWSCRDQLKIDEDCCDLAGIRWGLTGSVEDRGDPAWIRWRSKGISWGLLFGCIHHSVGRFWVRSCRFLEPSAARLAYYHSLGLAVQRLTCRLRKLVLSS